MSIERNKSIIRSWLSALANGRVDDAESLLDPGATWWVLDRGFVTLDYVKAFWRDSSTQAPGADAYKILSLTGEEDRVVLELEISVDLPDGTPYRNRMAMFFELRGGRMIAVREYLDGAHTRQLLGSADEHARRLGAVSA